MTASAQLSNRLAAAPARPLPAPPMPIPPVVDEAGVRRPGRSVPSSRLARLIAVITVTLAVIGGLGWLGQSPDPGVPQRTAMVRVGAGETVWDVAARVAPRSDQRAVVERIRQLNHMAGTAVQPDQQLLAPDGR